MVKKRLLLLSLEGYYLKRAENRKKNRIKLQHKSRLDTSVGCEPAYRAEGSNTVIIMFIFHKNIAVMQGILVRD